MKKIVSLLLVLLLCCFALTACGDSEKADSKTGADNAASSEKEVADVNPIVGTWKYNDSSLNYTYVFKADGTGTYFGEDFTYTVDGNTLSILYEGNTEPFVTEFEIDGDRLNVKDSFGSDTIYIKQ